jgi:hypothetical protein
MVTDIGGGVTAGNGSTTTDRDDLLLKPECGAAIAKIYKKLRNNQIRRWPPHPNKFILLLTQKAPVLPSCVGW